MLFKLPQLSSLLFLLPLLTSTSTATTTPSYARNATTGYGTITTTLISPFVVRAVISNPPINLYDYKMINDLYDFLLALQADPTPPKVIIFSSTDPAIFIQHIDIHTLTPATPSFNATYSTHLVNLDVLIVRLLRSLPIIFIGEINGLSTGAGTEFAVQLDMRFAGPKARIGALEVGSGVIHGNGGALHLTQLIGPGRAAEYLLSVQDVDAAQAEQYGWVNRAYKSQKELTQEVDKLAKRIAVFNAGALNGTKASIRSTGPTEKQLADDLVTFNRLVVKAETQKVLARFLELSKNQTRSAFEVGLDQTMLDLYE
ncbi:hypothetical protein MMC30_004032 [Trapelia coarctata]|nr:hypothetical protein [Trapelia coarctata]